MGELLLLSMLPTTMQQLLTLPPRVSFMEREKLRLIPNFLFMLFLMLIFIHLLLILTVHLFLLSLLTSRKPELSTWLPKLLLKLSAPVEGFKFKLGFKAIGIKIKHM